METLNTDKPPDLVANIEVMQILEEQIAARKEAIKARKSGAILRQRDWIEEKVLAYLKSTPCVQADTEKMPTLVKRLRGRPKEGFGLTDAETLQVLNFMPREIVEMHLMIEDLQGRMSDERQEELMNLVGSCVLGEGDVPADQKPEGGEEGIFDLVNGNDGRDNCHGNGKSNGSHPKDNEVL